MYRLVLNNESHFQDTVKSLNNMNFFGSISPDEKIRTAKDILCLMFLLNPDHIESHLSGISNATQTIQSWCDAIVNKEITPPAREVEHNAVTSAL